MPFFPPSTGTGAVTSVAGRTGAVVLAESDVANLTADLATLTTAVGARLLVASNLSDVASAAAARTNLGLGTAATHATGDFAQATNNLSDLPSAATARTNLGLAIGTNVLAPGGSGAALTGITASQVGADGALTPTAVKTSAYTAAVGDFVPVDASAASVTVTLPTAPADRSRVEVKLIAVSGAFTATVAAGGSDVFNKAGGSTTLPLNALFQTVQLQYATSGAIWYVIAADVSTGGYAAGTNITITTSAGVRTIAASGGGGMSIGGAVTSGTAGRVLYEGSGTPGVLADSANLTFDGTSLSINGEKFGGGGGSLYIAIGNSSVATSFSVSVGHSATGSGIFATAIGYSTTCAAQATAVGAAAVANFANSTALGFSATAAFASQVMLGTSAETVTLPGGFQGHAAAKSAAYTITYTDMSVFADATSGAFALTLPAATAARTGQQFTAKKVDSSGNAVTLTAAGSDLIDGAGTYALSAQWKYVTVQCGGLNKWYVVASN